MARKTKKTGYDIKMNHETGEFQTVPSEERVRPKHSDPSCRGQDNLVQAQDQTGPPN